MIKEILNQKPTGHISSGKFSISSIGCCWRKKYLEMKGLYSEEFGPDMQRIFEIGNVIHRQIVSELITRESSGLHLVAAETPIPEHKYLSGRIDAIVSADGESIIVDIKSASDWTIKNLQNGNTDIQGYTDQVLLYMYLTKIHKGILLFVGKSNGQLEEVEVEYDETRAEMLIKEIENFFINYVEKNIEPPKCNPSDSYFLCKCCHGDKPKQSYESTNSI